MVRITNRQENSCNWDDEGICPKIMKLVKEVGHSTRLCKSHKSRPGEFEIHEGRSQFPLSLNKMKCACGVWQLSGIPCRHAMRATIAEKLDPYKYVSSWFSVKTYKEIYNHNINVIRYHEQWPEFKNYHLASPAIKRGVGRPSRNRRREEGEEAKGKRARTVKCRNCGHLGHNSRTCKRGPTVKELQPTEPVVTLNKRKRVKASTFKKGSKKGKKVTN